MSNTELPERIWLHSEPTLSGKTVTPDGYFKRGSRDLEGATEYIRADLVSRDTAPWLSVVKALDDILQCFRNGAMPHRDIVDAAERAVAEAGFSAPAPSEAGALDSLPPWCDECDEHHARGAHDQPQRHAKSCDRWVQCGGHEHYEPIVNCTCPVSEAGAVTQQVYVSKYPLHLICNTCGLKQITSLQCPREDGQLVPDADGAVAAAREIVEDHLRPCAECFGDALPDVERAIAAIISKHCPAAPSPLRSITPDVAFNLLQVREALARMETDEHVTNAWHYLYKVANPGVDSFYPWAELERLAATPAAPSAGPEEPK